jgi:hypothetical protein
LLYFANGKLSSQSVGAASKKAILSQLQTLGVAV